MYTVTIKSIDPSNDVKARWLERDIECWLNKYQDEERIVYILRNILKQHDCYLPTGH